MSIVTVQLGQCGNQVGGAFFDMVSKEIRPRGVGNTQQDAEADIVAMDCFFRPSSRTTNPRNSTPVKQIARAVMIDMEPKVIQQTRALSLERGLFEYDLTREYFKQSGSANNWAYGFNVHGPASYTQSENNADSIRNMIRKEIECCDSFGGFLMMSSLAGGTGSGVGAYITQQLRDEYENSFLVNQVVWPYSIGEVIVQNYNTLLTLSTLHEHSDAIMIFDNDTLNLTCSKLLKIKSPSFSDMNQVISTALANILLPSYYSSFQQSGLSGPKLKRDSLVQLWVDPIKHLCAHPGYKLLSTKVIPQIATGSKQYSSYMWQGLLKHLNQMLITDAKLEENINWGMKLPDQSSFGGTVFTDHDRKRYTNINTSIANMLILRGAELDTVTPDTIDKYRHPLAYTRWMDRSDRLLLASHSKPFNNFDKSAVLLSNSQSIVIPLNNTLQKASGMYYSRAYIHQYEKYGIDNTDFENHFQNMEQILFNYQSL